MTTTPHPESQDGRQRPPVPISLPWNCDSSLGLIRTSDARIVCAMPHALNKNAIKMRRPGQDAAITDEQRFIVEACNAHAALSERVRGLEEALAPFAAVGSNVTSFGNVPPDRVYLWKPTDNRKELPGISAAHIIEAKRVLTAQRSEP